MSIDFNATFTDNDIDRFFNQGESQRVEFKSCLRDPVQVAKVITAFANTEGGILLVGIHERKGVVGVDIPSTLYVINRALELMAPLPIYKIHEIVYKEKKVVVIVVRKSERLVTSRGGVWVRIGESIVPAAPDKIQQLAQGKDSIKTLSSSLSQLTAAIDKLSQESEEQKALIKQLKKDSDKKDSIKNKIKEYILGGIIGIIIAEILKFIFGMGH